MDREGLQGLRVICIPPSLPISPPEPRLGEVWSGEGDLVAMATRAAFLLRMMRRRRRREFRAKPIPTNFSAPETQPGALGHPWVPPDAPCGQTGAGDGQQIHKNPVCPIWERALSSFWKGQRGDTGKDTGTICIPSFPGDGGYVALWADGFSQRAFTTPILGNHLFLCTFLLPCPPKSAQRTAVTPSLHPKPWGSISPGEGTDRGGLTQHGSLCSQLAQDCL